MSFKVLGPLAVEVNGREVAVPAGRCRVVLAVLLLCPNEVVPADELVKRAWPDGGSIGALRRVVARLRTALGEANCVRTVGSGYAAEPEDLDLLRFRELCEHGQIAEALTLWRGPALAEIDSEWVRNEVSALVEERRAAQRKLTVPKQIPSPPAQFVGRDQELEELDTAHGPLVISAVSGAAGVGKTALAMRWAHRAADRFPEGQLYVNLRGFDPAAEPVRPQEVIQRFLTALGVPNERMPNDDTSQAELYRDLVADKRLLFLLDNARDADQVRPLLPGSDRCQVIITSRNRMGDLAGARALRLGMLGHTEAVALVTARIGAERASAEPEALTRLAELCGGLPLALSVVAARAATDAQLPLAALADELADEQSRLDFLDTGEELTSVRATFSWSYQRLSPAAARLFRLLAAHPGPDFSAAAVFSLMGESSALDELTDVHLLQRTKDGRYYFHDLVRLFARELTNDDERRDALHHLLDHYVHSAYRTMQTLQISHRVLTLTDPLPGVTPETIDAERGWAWFEAEVDVLIGLVAVAEQAGFDTSAWQLTWCLTNALDRAGRRHEWVDVAELGLAAAIRLDDVYARSQMREVLGRAYRCAGRFDNAVTVLNEAIDDYRTLGETLSASSSYQVLAALHGDQGRHAEALGAARQALALDEEVGSVLGVAASLNQIGWFSDELGDHRSAVEHCEQAVALLQGAGQAYLEAAALNSLAKARRNLGDLAGALAAAERSVELITATGYLPGEAEAWRGLGDAHHAAGNREQARKAWLQSLALYEHIEGSAANSIRDRLTKWAAGPSSG
ncbi:DNA-binding SARP family transcriptional activator [Lentzea atacamensis]|uniref:DNA-binding SARP family transcriptional activator n=1 Tax=Lentzea atacamensis TaxID=531938 RepID=A0A316I0C1_9PSEU|nr:tetratricopeptide repeat protein [Lentzea atacamensis]PWK86396.1 DNA-binding SARP family transcriptional activator [Lentzea atacamensis]